MRFEALDDRCRIIPDGQAPKSGGVSLYARGEALAWLRISFLCRIDSANRYLAIDTCNFWIGSVKDRTPIWRFEYVRDARTDPCSHIQVHAERGSLSHLLARTGHDTPHEMRALRLPTGGPRFRPGLEDVIQFAIQECRFDSVAGWEGAVRAERAEWRGIQTRTAARGMPAEAAAALRELGYQVTPPPDGDPTPGRKARWAW